MSKVAVYIMFMLVKFAAIYVLAFLGWILYILKIRDYRRYRLAHRAAQAQLAIYIAAEARRAEQKAARMRKVRGGGRKRKGSTGSPSTPGGSPSASFPTSLGIDNDADSSGSSTPATLDSPIVEKAPTMVHSTSALGLWEEMAGCDGLAPIREGEDDEERKQ